MEFQKGPGRFSYRLQRARAAASPRRGAALGEKAGRVSPAPPLVAGGGPGFSF